MGARERRVAGLHGIYAIVNAGPRAVAIAQAALSSGVRLIQYRAKSGIVPDELRQLRVLTAAHDALLILNDDWRAAIAFECDGVHLGPEDAGFADPQALRLALGDRLIGLSCGTLAEVTAAVEADYLGIGPVYATASKADAGAAIGPAGLAALAAQTALPVAAIGGIEPETIAPVRAAGAAMAAVISAIAGAPEPAAAAQRLVAAWNESGVPAP
jgi:thiamine-phosphate pyrophosphorylase